MEKLTPEGAAAKEARGYGDAYSNQVWNEVASAAVDASDEVKRLRQDVRRLREERDFERDVIIYDGAVVEVDLIDPSELPDEQDCDGHGLDAYLKERGA